MANIGTLAVKVVANASGLKTGLDQSASMVTGFANKFKSLVGGGLPAVLGAAGPIGLAAAAGVAAVGALAASFRALSAGISETGRSAARLNVAVEDVSALQYAAARSGVDVETLDKAMFKLARQSATGDVMKDFFNTVDQFNRDDGINKAALAQHNLGRAAIFMTPLLGKGKEGIRGLMEEARRLGVVLSQADVDKVKAANGALKQIDFVLAGVKNRLVVAFAPAMQSMAETFLQYAPQISSAATTVADVITSHWYAAKVVIDFLGESMRQVGAAVEAMGGGAIVEWAEQWLSAGSIVKNMLKGLLAVFGTFFDFVTAGVGGVVGALGLMAEGIGALMAKLPGAVGEAGEKLRAAGEAARLSGAKMIGGFGKTVPELLRAFDALFNNVEARGKRTAETIASQYQAAGAFVEGSQQALSVEARWKTESMSRGAPAVAEAKKANEKLEAIRNILEDVRRKFGGEPVRLEVI